MLPLLEIRLPFNPNLIDTGGFVLAWHGLLSFAGVATAVWLVGRWARRDRLDPDTVYNTAIWAILGGIVGARVVHVADNWGSVYGFDDPISLIAVWSGGIALWGAILGGWIAGMIYAYISKYPIGKLMDLTAPAVLIAQSIGRVGDVINGEHWSRNTDLFWGWVFTNPANAGFNPPRRLDGILDPTSASHPAVVYEIIWNMLVLAVIWRFRDRFRPAGSLWMIYLGLYAFGRFWIQFLRLDDEKFWNLQEAHLIALGIMAISVTFVILKVRFRKPGDEPDVPEAPERRSRGRLRRARQRGQERASAG
ncbi:MAG: prolipoprotein diacylglyceryl transferase [Chloroflexi bacterium]|nr:prolipoprotein diacylglyceryl transferase [Chloroflexota bacterium]MCH8235952.1 prolipoprotein diacylglyceryl transferase [Chloroflexota bacterium]MCH8816877.1 prolipoprotein diacylglyceryl transferase [Chloroflexota bacterium]